MSNLPTFTEIFAEADSKKTDEEKIAVLHKYSSKHLKEMLSYTFDKNIVWLVPPGTPPYEPAKEDGNVLRQRLYQEMKRLVHFLNIGPYPNMAKMKRESMFIDMLQTIHPDDAKLLCHIKDNRDLPWKSLDKKLLGVAFPTLVAKWK